MATVSIKGGHVAMLHMGLLARSAPYSVAAAASVARTAMACVHGLPSAEAEAAWAKVADMAEALRQCQANVPAILDVDTDTGEWKVRRIETVINWNTPVTK